MFSALQQRTWSTAHLAAGAWYLECIPSYTPSFEIELRKSREAIGESGIEMVDLAGIEDETERAKAIKRRIEEDRKKALKVKEAEEKAQQKELERQQKASEKKASRKGKRKVSTPGEDQGKSPQAPSPTRDSGSQVRTISTRGTRRDSTFELLTQVPVLDCTEEDNHSIGEFILNSSMDLILGGESEVPTPAYYELVDFLSKVL